jgi:hypothetical protein
MFQVVEDKDVLGEILGSYMSLTMWLFGTMVLLTRHI